MTDSFKDIPFQSKKKRGEVGILAFQTLLDLQTAYPNGVNQPVWVNEESKWYYWENEVKTYSSFMIKQGVTPLTSSTLTFKGNLFKPKKRIELREVAAHVAGSPGAWYLHEYSGSTLSTKLAEGAFVAGVLDADGYLKQGINPVTLDPAKSYILIVKYNATGSRYIDILPNNGMDDSFMLALSGAYNFPTAPTVGAALGGTTAGYIYDYKFTYSEVL